MTQLPVSTEPAETVLQRRLRRHTGVSGPLLHRYTALRRNRRSRDGVALRSERSAVAGSTPGAVRPADASTDLVPFELEADLVICQPIDGAVTFGSACIPRIALFSQGFASAAQPCSPGGG